MGLRSIVSGGVAQALAVRLEDAIACHQVAGILSVGIGGALSPNLAVGDWVVGERVTDGRTSWETDAAWTKAIAASLGPAAHLGALAGSDVMVADSAAKTALYRLTGALGVDMESHVAARVAAAHNIPFAALRVISDTASRTLPRAALAGMRPDGGMNLAGVLWALAKSPGQLPALIRTGEEAGAAFKALALLGGDNLLCGPGIGCPYLGELLFDVT
jgi:hopanoid-associated phosphorylase